MWFLKPIKSLAISLFAIISFSDCQTLYQKKAEGFEKELVIAKQKNKRLKAKVENLRNQLEQNVSSTIVIMTLHVCVLKSVYHVGHY